MAYGHSVQSHACHISMCETSQGWSTLTDTLSMFAYWVLMSVSILLVKVIGQPLCMRTGPNPYSLVSVCTMTGLDLSKYMRMALRRVWQIQALRCWKAASVEGFQSHSVSCSCKNVILVERLGTKGYR